MHKTTVFVFALMLAFAFGSIGTAKYIKYIKYQEATTEVDCAFVSPIPNKELLISFGYKNGKFTKLHCYVK